jgi:hypothetical protein
MIIIIDCTRLGFISALSCSYLSNQSSFWVVWEKSYSPSPLFFLFFFFFLISQPIDASHPFVSDIPSHVLVSDVHHFPGHFNALAALPNLGKAREGVYVRPSPAGKCMSQSPQVSSMPNKEEVSCISSFIATPVCLDMLASSPDFNSGLRSGWVSS